MKSVLLIACLLVAATLVLLPEASARPLCVDAAPGTPNPVRVDWGECRPQIGIICQNTVGQVDPEKCP